MLAGSVIAAFAVFSGCGPPGVGFDFDNRTDVAFCKYLHPEDAEIGRCLTEIPPHEETGSGADCDGERGRMIRVLLVVKESGQIVYDRSASCGDWSDAGGGCGWRCTPSAKFVIEQDGFDFIVTDSLEPK
jgi:hypothetical protein